MAHLKSYMTEVWLLLYRELVCLIEVTLEEWTLCTCTPHEVSTIGWLGTVIEQLDPGKENPLTGVNFGVGLPRAMSKAGIPVTSVSNLDEYGLMSGLAAEDQRDKALKIFKDMYAQAIGSGPVMDYLSRTGSDVITGADMIKVAQNNTNQLLSMVITK